jgi:anti-sigma-K factor RskA
MAKSEIERLVVVETKLDALIKSNQEQSAKLDMLISNYVHRTEYEKDIDSIRNDIEKTKAETARDIEKAKARSALQVWITSSLAAVLGAVMAILIQGYFNK